MHLETAFTAVEYAAMLDRGAFDDLRVELVQGELRKLMMPSGFSHGEMNATLMFELRTAFAGTDCRFAVDLAVEIDALTVRGADIAIVRPDTPRGQVPARYVVMVAEVALTTIARDLGEKLADYARAGIADYWVADLEAAVMHVMRDPEGDRYRERRVVPFGTPLAVPGTDRQIVIG